MRTSDQIGKINSYQPSSEKHDKIVAWLYTNIEKLIEQDIPSRDIKDFFIMAKNDFEKKGALPELCNFKKHIEYPVRGRSDGFGHCPIKGFIDLAVFVPIELNYTNRDKSIERVRTVTSSIYIEIKSTVDFTSTIRQIKFYQSFIDDGAGQYEKNFWCVCSPDTKYRDIFREQGIYFIEAPANLP